MTQLVFIGGMGRSGTNLLRRMLNSHSVIASGPEFNHIEDIIKLFRKLYTSIEQGRTSAYLTTQELIASYRAFIESLFEPYAHRRDARIVVEKTPSNIWFFPELSFIFPDAKFINLMRDGRDVACSHREVGQRMVKAGETISTDRDSALVSIFHCATLWNETIRFGMSLSQKDSPLARANRILSVKYEDLVAYPEQEIRRLCRFLDVSYEPEMLVPEELSHDTFTDGFWVIPEDSTRPVSQRSVGRWRSELSLRERVIFSAKGQEGLLLAGYENSGRWAGEGLNVDPEKLPSEIRSAECEVQMHIARSSADAMPPLEVESTQLHHKRERLHGEMEEILSKFDLLR